MDAESKPYILFVDDEEAVLAGLRQTLRKARKRWDLDFACGGDEALAKLAARPADVVVTDMRMPGFTGAALLEQVAEQHPATLRFVLSGEASEKLAARAIPFTHQWMSKPCEREVIVRTIDRALALYGHLATDAIRATVGSVSALPAAPETYSGVMRALRDPDVELGTLADWIERDPGLTARVLQLSNSSFFGVRRRVDCVRDAVATLGLRLLAEVVLVAEVFESWGGGASSCGRAPEEVLGHSQQVVQLARRVADDAHVDPSGCMTAALLHDVGALVLARKAPELAAAVQARDGCPRWQAEEQQLGCSHADIGGALLQAWGLPLSIVEAVTFHHAPARAGSSEFDSVGVVHVANALVEGSAVDAAYLESVGVLDRLEAWRTFAAEIEEGGAAA